MGFPAASAGPDPSQPYANPSYRPVIPARHTGGTGIHRAGARTVERWVPVCAGTTAERPRGLALFTRCAMRRGSSQRGRMLEIQDLSVSYGGLAALRGVSLTVDEGQFVAIVGPNGAGKTTPFKAMSRTVAPVSGAILVEGRDLLAVPPPARAHPALAH